MTTNTNTITLPAVNLSAPIHPQSSSHLSVYETRFLFNATNDVSVLVSVCTSIEIGLHLTLDGSHVVLRSASETDSRTYCFFARGSQRDIQALRAVQYLYSYDPRVACIFPTSTAGKGTGPGLQGTIPTMLEKSVFRPDNERHVEWLSRRCFSVQFCSANLMRDALKLILVTLSSSATIDVERHNVTLERGLSLIGTPAKTGCIVTSFPQEIENGMPSRLRYRDNASSI